MTYVYDAPVRELHHRLPRCLLAMRDQADNHPDRYSGEAMQMWLDYESECSRFGIHPDTDREILAAMIRNSAYYVRQQDHREYHESNGDFARWGRRGGLTTLRRYGSHWYALLALRRWEKITPEELAGYLDR